MSEASDDIWGKVESFRAYGVKDFDLKFFTCPWELDGNAIEEPKKLGTLTKFNLDFYSHDKNYLSLDTLGRILPNAYFEDSGNLMIGEDAGSLNIGDSDLIFIGRESGNLLELRDSIENSIALGANARIFDSNEIQFGNDSITDVNSSVNVAVRADLTLSNVSTTDTVVGLAFIDNLNPIIYEKNGSDQTKYTGFLPSEVEATAIAANYDFSGVLAPVFPGQYYGLRYAEFVVPLIKAVQEQQDVIEAQQIIIEDHENRIDVLEAQVQALIDAMTKPGKQDPGSSKF